MKENSRIRTGAGIIKTANTRLKTTRKTNNSNHSLKNNGTKNISPSPTNRRKTRFNKVKTAGLRPSRTATNLLNVKSTANLSTKTKNATATVTQALKTN